MTPSQEEIENPTSSSAAQLKDPENGDEIATQTLGDAAEGSSSTKIAKSSGKKGKKGKSGKKGKT